MQWYNPFGEEDWGNINNPGIEDHSDVDPFGEEIWEHRTGPTITRNLLPVSVRPAARTIGSDLVVVRPLGTPSSTIDYHYNDFKYGIERENPKGKQIFSDIDPFGEETWLV